MIIQISKIQHRSGELVDLPQLDQAEFGFATDVNRLFIGKTTGNIENVEVLTAYSNIAFNQIEGSVGNLNISANVANGEILTYDGNDWVNSNSITVGSVTTTVLTSGANTTPATITGNWQLTAGSVLESLSGDLAEYYSGDKQYKPGTVLEFGGDSEVTLAGIESNKIAGVVTTEPAYVMNSNIQAKNPIALALIGRVPVKVIGKVNKGDMLVSAGNGLAKASTVTPKIGTVIGKAINNKTDDDEGIIEVLIGRT